jgi:hypothetical protein
MNLVQFLECEKCLMTSRTANDSQELSIKKKIAFRLLTRDEAIKLEWSSLVHSSWQVMRDRNDADFLICDIAI